MTWPAITRAEPGLAAVAAVIAAVAEWSEVARLMTLNPAALAAAFLLLALASAPPALAHCPLCAGATGALVAFTRGYGVDDAVVGTFFGAFVVSSALWLDRVLVKRFGKKHLPFQAHVFSAAFFFLTVAGFYWSGALVSAPDALKLYGLDKLVFGTALGSVVSIAAFEAHALLKSGNKNKNFFPMQGIVVLFGFLVAVNALLYAAGLV